jgi:hypothetical protein
MGGGASKRVTLEGKTTEQARAEGAAQVQQLVSGILKLKNGESFKKS